MNTFNVDDQVQVVFSHDPEGDVIVGAIGVVTAVLPDEVEIVFGFEYKEEWADYAWTCTPDELALVK